MGTGLDFQAKSQCGWI